MSLRMLKQQPERIQVLVKNVEYRQRPSGEEFTQLEVADFTGCATLRWWRDWGFDYFPGEGDVVEGIVTPRRLDGRLWLDTNWLEPTAEDERLLRGPAFLSRNDVPESAHPSLEKLVAIFNGIQEKSLRTFLGRVFTDPGISTRFVRCRASANHHHREPGGLLTHSVGVAERCSSNGSGLERSKHELVIAAALLHDIGKLETVGEGPKRPALAPWVHHEALTLEILAPHLRWLDGEWPHGAALLRHCLTWYSTKPAGFAGFVGADILRAMDGIDVGIGMGKGSGEARYEPFRASMRLKA